MWKLAIQRFDERWWKSSCPKWRHNRSVAIRREKFRPICGLCLVSETKVLTSSWKYVGLHSRNTNRAGRDWELCCFHPRTAHVSSVINRPLFLHVVASISPNCIDLFLPVCRARFLSRDCLPSLRAGARVHCDVKRMRNGGKLNNRAEKKKKEKKTEKEVKDHDYSRFTRSVNFLHSHLTCLGVTCR